MAAPLGGGNKGQSLRPKRTILSWGRALAAPGKAALAAVRRTRRDLTVIALTILLGFAIGVEYTVRVVLPSRHPEAAPRWRTTYRRPESISPPPRISQPVDPPPAGAGPATQPADPPADTQRCTAMTRRGERCLRQAQPNRDRCWQH